jgi:hypothetical protein
MNIPLIVFWTVSKKSKTISLATEAKLNAYRKEAKGNYFEIAKEFMYIEGDPLEYVLSEAIAFMVEEQIHDFHCVSV